MHETRFILAALLLVAVGCSGKSHPIGPTHLVVTGQPQTSVAGTSIAGISVEVHDARDRVVKSSTEAITVGIGSGPSGATLAGTTTVDAVAGVAAFSGLSLQVAGSYTLHAQSAKSTATDTASFAIVAASAASLRVAGFPSSVVAGSSGAVTLTAFDAFANVATGYAGTVAFTSTDGLATLPAPYSFVAADAGTKSFAVTLRRASATSSITAGDGILSASQNAIVVTPAAAASLSITGAPASAVAGNAFGFQVTAKDPFGNVATSYAGSVTFHSSDAQAVLPAAYDYVGGDAGRHAFSVELRTAAADSAIDVGDTMITGSASGITVSAAAASQLGMSGFAAPQPAGQAGTVTVAALDRFGNRAVYTGTVTLASDDARATLPASYAYQAGDAGTHDFAVTLRTPSTTTTVSASDANGLTGKLSPIEVDPGAPAALAWLTTPPTQSACTVLPQQRVGVFDIAGNALTTDGISVQVALASGKPLSGTTTEATSGGVAVFDDLAVESVQSGAALVASASGLTGATSTGFDGVFSAPDIVSIDPLPSSLTGCVAVHYDFAPGCRDRVRIVPQFAPSGAAPLTRATQCGSAPGLDGVDGVLRDGSPHVFSWNTARDFPHQALDGARISIGAVLDGAAGASATQTGLSIRNQPLQFTAGPVDQFEPYPYPDSQSIAFGDMNRDGKVDMLVAGRDTGEIEDFRGEGLGEFSGISLFTVRPANFPSAIVIADMNRDGKPDVVAIANVFKDVEVLLGNGDGSMQSPIATANFGNDFSALAVGDVNRDGIPDVVVVDQGASRLGVFLGNGDGTLQAMVPYATDSQPEDVVLADMDRNGTLDAIVGYKSGSAATVFFGAGDGTFPSSIDVPTGAEPDAVGAVDLDGDGVPDLLGVVGTSFEEMGVAFGTTAGTFGSFTAASGGAENVHSEVMIADFDGDGRPEAFSIAIGGFLEGFLEELDVRGGGLDYSSNAYDFGSFHGGGAQGTADVDGDGRPDIVVQQSGADEIVALNQSPRPIDPRVAILPTAADVTPPTRVAVGDLNGDGKADFVTRSGASFLGRGNGAFDAVAPAVSTSAGDIALADMDGDGVLDEVRMLPAAVTVAHGDGAGFFGTPVVTPSGSDLSALAIADMNGDGIPDVLVADAGSADVCILPGDGFGGFGGATCIGVGPTPSAIAVADVDGDGRPDLFVGDANPTVPVLFFPATNFASDTAFAIGSGGLSVTSLRLAPTHADATLDLIVSAALGAEIFAGDGAGGFTFASSLPGVGVSAVVDVDGDGRLDVVGPVVGGGVNAALGNGDGTFTVTPTSAAALIVGAESVAAADVDGDGKPDLLVPASAIADTVTVLPGRGDGTFSFPVLAAGPTNAAAAQVALGDFNRDGKQDLVTADSNGASLSLGVGDGTFGAPTLVSNANAQSIAIADVNRDGKLDLVVTHPSGNSVEVRLGNGAGGFGSAILTSVSNPHDATVGDVNRDGKPDVVVTDGASSVIVLPGLGNGSFGSPISSFISAGALGPMLGDLDRDGKLDVVTTAGYAHGNGDGSFGTATPLGFPADAVALADLDGDGTLDLAASFGAANPHVWIAFGDGAGGFLAPSSFTTAGGGRSIAIADLDGDGTLDLITSPDSTILYGRGSRTFEVSELNSALGDLSFTGPHGIVVGDLDRDGAPDVVLANSPGALVLLGRW